MVPERKGKKKEESGGGMFEKEQREGRVSRVIIKGRDRKIRMSWQMEVGERQQRDEEHKAQSDGVTKMQLQYCN